MPIARNRGWPYRHPPNTAITLNRDSPQFKGLVYVATGAMQGQGTHFHDMVYNQRASPTGTPLFVRDPEMGGALSNPGVGWGAHYSPIAPLNDLHTGDFSIAVWFRSRNASEWQRTFYKGNFAAGWALQTRGSSQRIYFAVYYDTTNAVLDQGGYTNGEWTHVVCVSRGPSNNLFCYVNGQYLVDEGTGEGAATSDAAENLVVGGSSVPNEVAQTRIYNRVLTANDAQQQYQIDTRWDLYKPVISRFWSIPEVVGGQPFQLRMSNIPGMRQWTPGKIGR